MDNQPTPQANNIPPFKDSPTPPTPGTNKAVPIRTYAEDIKSTIQHKNVSVVKMVLAENKRREDQKTEKEENSPSSPKNIILIALSIFFIVGGIGLVTYLSFIKKADQTPLLVDLPESGIIRTESIISIPGDTLERSGIIEAMERIKTSEIKLNTMTEGLFTIGTGTAKTRMPSTEFFNLLESRMPDTLLRAIGYNFMIGVHAFDGNNTYMILTTESFEHAYAGMLSWEPYMRQDIGIFFSTASTATNASTTVDLLKFNTFEDTVIKNKDIRILKNEKGGTELMYGFVDPTTIVITTSSYTLQEIMERLKVSKLVR
jgi:hypothetical protein